MTRNICTSRLEAESILEVKDIIDDAISSGNAEAALGKLFTMNREVRDELNRVMLQAIHGVLLDRDGTGPAKKLPAVARWLAEDLYDRMRTKVDEEFQEVMKDNPRFAFKYDPNASEADWKVDPEEIEKEAA